MTQRKIEYLQQKEKGSKEYTNTNFQDYRLKTNDELVVQISSLDDPSSNVFSNTGQNLSNINPYGASLMSRSIDKEGYLELPVIGKVLAKDKTISELSTNIKESLTNILNQPVVNVKLVNRFVTVLGEVRSPGNYVYSRDKFSVLDAIGLAGDITDYGNHKDIILIRNENNVNTRIELNLLNADILSSNYYYLRPGDVIYIKPMRSKFWGLRQFPFSLLLSSVTTTILVLNYYNNNYR